MAITIDSIVENIIKAEGSAYTNDPKDSGGPTKFGVTLKTLSAYRGKPCTALDVQNMQIAEARAIYKKMYFYDHSLDKLAAISPPIAAEVMDTGVNIGPSRAISLLQRLLNALNLNGKLYPDLTVDGQFGPAGERAMQAYLNKRGKEGEKVLLVALNAVQAEYYLDLVERRPKDEDFFYGWIKERVAHQL